MKAQASIVLSFQAKTLTDGGAVLDDVLARARDREDVDLAAVELISPPADRQVTVPTDRRVRARWAPRAVYRQRREPVVAGEWPLRADLAGHRRRSGRCRGIPVARRPRDHAGRAGIAAAAGAAAKRGCAWSRYQLKA